MPKEDTQWKPGQSGNPAGKPVGTRSFTTDFDEVVSEIAKANNITNSEARKILIKKAYAEAKDGNFQYYKDIHDRVYGKAEDNVNVKGDLIVKVIDYARNNDTAPVRSKRVSNAISSERKAIQDSDTSSKGWKIKDGIKQPDTKSSN